MINPCFPQNECSAYSKEYPIWPPAAFRFCPIASMLSTATQLRFLHFPHLRLDTILLLVVESVDQCARVFSHSSLGALSVSRALCLVRPLSGAVNLSHSLSRALSVSHVLLSLVSSVSHSLSLHPPYFTLSVSRTLCLVHPLSRTPCLARPLSCARLLSCAPSVLHALCLARPLSRAPSVLCALCSVRPLSCAPLLSCAPSVLHALCPVRPLFRAPSVLRALIYYALFSHPLSCTFCPSSSLAPRCLLVGCGEC